jgi:hypothetical protein
VPAPGADPARLRIEEDLAGQDFDAGVDAGRWHMVRLCWPRLFVTVSCGDGGRLGMRIAVDGYPRLAPAGEPWDLHRGQPLPQDLWPQGVPQVFRRDWSVGNGNAPYLACDRTGLATHPGWPAQHPDRVWHPGRNIAFYLRELYHGLAGTTLPGTGTTE